jgi:hypothetical protein
MRGRFRPLGKFPTCTGTAPVKQDRPLALNAIYITDKALK